MKELLDHEDFPITWKVKPNMTALSMASNECTDENAETVRKILEVSQDINHADNTGRTALHFACAGGKSKNVEALLAAEGVDKDIRSFSGDTPLMRAVGSGDIFTVVACLNAGCNPFLANGLNETALTKAA